jgi:archaemetzincin
MPTTAPTSRKLAVAAAVALLAVAAATVVHHAAAGRPNESDRQLADRLTRQAHKLRPLHTTLGKPQPGDWLEAHREPGQTFRQYWLCRPVLPVGKRRVLYIQPLGTFSETQRKIVDLTAEFMRCYFALPVKVARPLPLSIIPAKARRVHPTWGVKQILSTYVLDKVLVPRLPPDAAACIAFTPSDLWPGRGWNYVFGQASLTQRVGVWSLHRNGDPDAGEAAFRLCLLRTLKTATHETGHMFSMEHCIAYECNMCGSNHLTEADSRPLALCPQCLPKLCWAMKTEMIPRYRKLWLFATKHGLKAEAAIYAKSIQALGGRAPTTQPRTETPQAADP